MLGEQLWMSDLSYKSKFQLFNIMFRIGRLSFIIRKTLKMTSNIFLSTFARFKHTQSIQEIAQASKKQLNIGIYHSINLKVGDILQRFQHLEKRYSKSLREENNTSWKQEQKKVFLSFLLAYCHLFLKKISEITQQEWQDISQAFHHKNILLMKYEAKTVDKTVQRVHWDFQQELLLCSCITSQTNGKWATISRHIFFQSNGQAYKTPKQCRQHWFNHMNKSLKHGGWSIHQDLIILYSVLDYGHKWARIVDLLQGKRTQHMIKNRFHSLLTTFSKLEKHERKQQHQSKFIKMIINELTAQKQGMSKEEKKINNYRLGQQGQIIKGKQFSVKQNNPINQIDIFKESYKPKQVKQEELQILAPHIHNKIPIHQGIQCQNTLNLTQHSFQPHFIIPNHPIQYFFVVPYFSNAAVNNLY